MLICKCCGYQYHVHQNYCPEHVKAGSTESWEMAERDMSTLITVTGLQKNFSNEDIELYFETQKSGGSNGCVKKCIIDRDGVAIIEFNSPEVAANVVSKGHHKLFGCSLAVQYAPADDIVKRSKLLVTQLPSEIEMDYLKALLEKTLGTDKFSLEMSANSTATIIFHNIYTDAEFRSLIARLESKQVSGVNLKAQQIKEIPIHTSSTINTGALTSVKVTGLPTNVNDEEVELYFETQKSGGRKGSIRKCVIENNGVAFLEFDDPEVAANVVSKGEHTLYGCLLSVQYVTPEQIAKNSKLLLTQLPFECDMDYLPLLLEKALELQLIITKLESTKGRCRNLKVLTEDTPKTWEKMPIDTQTKMECMCHLFDLKTSSQEFLAVHQRLALSVTAKKIISIQRVQNIMLYGQYIARKNAMEKLNPPITNNESLLFHGTSADTIPKINHQGFNRSFAGKHMTPYGRGTYFAVDASYSAYQTYSPPDANGHKYMYLVRVLTGEFTVGNSTMYVPPAKNPTINPNVLFDSLVDRFPNPLMYIIFQDAQAYPEYLITFVM